MCCEPDVTLSQTDCWAAVCYSSFPVQLFPEHGSQGYMIPNTKRKRIFRGVLLLLYVCLLFTDNFKK